MFAFVTEAGVRLMPRNRFLSCSQLRDVSSSSLAPTTAAVVVEDVAVMLSEPAALTKSIGSVATSTMLPTAAVVSAAGMEL